MAAITASGSIRSPPASSTPVSSKPSTRADDLDPALADRLDDLGVDDHRRDVQPLQPAEDALLGHRQAERAQVADLLARTKRMTASPICGGSLWNSVASGAPIGARTMMFGGVRTASRTRARPALDEVVGDLGAGAARADDEHVAARVRRRRAVPGGVEELAAEARAARPRGHVRPVLVAAARRRRGAACSRPRRSRAPALAVALDALDA